MHFCCFHGNSTNGGVSKFPLFCSQKSSDDSKRRCGEIVPKRSLGAEKGGNGGHSCELCCPCCPFCRHNDLQLPHVALIVLFQLIAIMTAVKEWPVLSTIDVRNNKLSDRVRRRRLCYTACAAPSYHNAMGAEFHCLFSGVEGAVPPRQCCIAVPLQSRHH